MNNVIVKVIGVQKDIYGTENCIETTAVGRYYLKNGVHYVTYQDRELEHNEAETTTVLKVYPGHVVLLRMGSIGHRQEFHPGQKTSSTYVTPYGSMSMTVFTTQINSSFGAASGTIDISYELEVDGQWQSENVLTIIIQEGLNFGH